jgi:hypothetical protein
MCKTEVRRGSEGALRGYGQWCCSQSHADADVCRLWRLWGGTREVEPLWHLVRLMPRRWLPVAPGR